MSESTEGIDSTSSADVQAADAPAGSVVFGYGNGAFAWSGEDWARFPEDRKVVIDVYIPGEDVTNAPGDILDVEASYLEDNSPSRADALNQAHAWTTAHRARGKTPGWYTSAAFRAVLEPIVGEGVWFLADWTGEEHQDPGAGVIATQYGSPSRPAPGEGHWDLSDIDNEAFDAWYQANHGAEPTPAPAPAPAPAPTQGEAEVQVPEVQQGSTGPAVEAVQKLVGGVAVDGDFGPLTAEAVRNFQHGHGLNTDGIVGPHTWGMLVGCPQ